MRLTDKDLADLIDCVSEIQAGDFEGSTWDVGDGGAAASERLKVLHKKLCHERDRREMKKRNDPKHNPPSVAHATRRHVP